MYDNTVPGSVAKQNERRPMFDVCPRTKRKMKNYY